MSKSKHMHIMDGINNENLFDRVWFIYSCWGTWKMVGSIVSGREMHAWFCSWFVWFGSGDGSCNQNPIINVVHKGPLLLFLFPFSFPLSQVNPSNPFFI